MLHCYHLLPEAGDRKGSYKSVENAHGIHYGRCGPSELATVATKDGKPQ